MKNYGIVDIAEKLVVGYQPNMWSVDLHNQSIKEMWDQEDRGDLMLLAAGMLDINREALVKSACLIARTALKNIPEGEDRPLRAIESAEGWLGGRLSADEVKYLSRQGTKVRSAPGNIIPAISGYSAACAADTVWAVRVLDAPYSGSYTAYWAARLAAAANSENSDDQARFLFQLAEFGKIVKKVIPWEMIEEKLAKI